MPWLIFTGLGVLAVAAYKNGSKAAGASTLAPPVDVLPTPVIAYKQPVATVQAPL